MSYEWNKGIIIGVTRNAEGEAKGKTMVNVRGISSGVSARKFFTWMATIEKYGISTSTLIDMAVIKFDFCGTKQMSGIFWMVILRSNQKHFVTTVAGIQAVLNLAREGFLYAPMLNH